MAADRGYEELSKKAESYEICFVPDNDYRGFLRRRHPEMVNKLAGGLFKNTHGEVIGTHEGYPFYTIGQRKGLGQAFGTPKYVTEIRPEENVVILGDVEDLLRNGMMVYDVNLQKYASIKPGLETRTMVRYNDPGTMAELYPEGKELRVEFLAAVKGIAPGQSAVFYEGDDVVGGGRIKGSITSRI